MGKRDVSHPSRTEPWAAGTGLTAAYSSPGSAYATPWRAPSTGITVHQCPRARSPLLPNNEGLSGPACPPSVGSGQPVAAPHDSDDGQRSSTMSSRAGSMIGRRSDGDEIEVG